MSTPYEDIIHMEHPTSKKHPRMSNAARAAQFAPFSALTGYGDAVQETARYTDRRIELDEYEIAALDARFQEIQEKLAEKPEVTITYFVPDEKKEGGAYENASGRVKKIDPVGQRIVFTDGKEIPITEVIEISLNR